MIDQIIKFGVSAVMGLLTLHAVWGSTKRLLNDAVIATIWAAVCAITVFHLWFDVIL